MASGAAAASALPGLVAKGERDRREVKALEKDEIGSVNYDIERIRLQRRKLDYREKQGAHDLAALRLRLDERETALKARYAGLEEKLAKRMEGAGASRVVFRTVDGQEKELRAFDMYRAYPANELSWPGRVRVYASRLWSFLADEPARGRTRRAASSRPSSARS